MAMMMTVVMVNGTLARAWMNGILPGADDVDDQRLRHERLHKPAGLKQRRA